MERSSNVPHHRRHRMGVDVHTPKADPLRLIPIEQDPTQIHFSNVRIPAINAAKIGKPNSVPTHFVTSVFPYI